MNYPSGRTRLFAPDLDREALFHWKWGDRDSGACEQVVIIKELSDAVKKRVPLALCLNDLVRSEALAFLDIPYDVRVDTVAFSGQ